MDERIKELLNIIAYHSFELSKANKEYNELLDEIDNELLEEFLPRKEDE